MGAAVRDVEGRGPAGPCGRDRQILLDYHPLIRVLLPTTDGMRSVRIVDLMPLVTVRTAEAAGQHGIPLAD